MWGASRHSPSEEELKPTPPWKEGSEMGKLRNIQGKAANCLHHVPLLQKSFEDEREPHTQTSAGIRIEKFP